MRKPSVIVIRILFCLAVSVASLAKAEVGGRHTFSIPFDFMVQGQKLPAGEYYVERVNQSDPNVLIISRVTGELTHVFLTQRREASMLESRSTLVFLRCENSYFLFQIWRSDDGEVREVPGDTPACTQHRQQVEAVVVRRRKD